MLQKRQPLGLLDSNKQAVLDKRVQPSRAAKTSHKWLSQKKENAENISAKPLGYCLPGHRQNSTASYDDKENLGVTRITAFTKSKSEHHGQYEEKPRHRKPLQTLSVPSMKPFLRRNVDNSLNAINGYEKRFFPPLPKYAEENSEETTMSVSLDTISDSSLLECDIADQHEINDSAFFSCTQTSAPGVSDQDTQCEKDQGDHNRTKMISRRSSVGLDHNVDIIDEYFEDILLNMRLAESKYQITPDFMQRQPEISSNMRTKLVDWLIEVQDEYKLENETVALAVGYCDRFLSLMSVARSKLQLLGTTAMFIASKYEEIYPPDADEFAYVTADTYGKSEVILMERLILRVLGSAMAIPTALQFLGLLLHNSGATVQFKALATYLTEISMLHDRFYRYPRSVLAAAAMSTAHCLTRKCNSESGKVSVQNEKDAKSPIYVNFYCDTSSTVRLHMKDFQNEIYACTLDLIESHKNIEMAPQQFVREKYSTKANFKVATVPSLSDEKHSGDSQDKIWIKELVRTFWA